MTVVGTEFVTQAVGLRNLLLSSLYHHFLLEGYCYCRHTISSALLCFRRFVQWQCGECECLSIAASRIDPQVLRVFDRYLLWPYCGVACSDSITW